MKRLLVALALCIAIPAWPQQRCAPPHVDVQDDHTSATASPGANLRKTRDSLEVKLSQLLAKAQEQLAKILPPRSNACSTNCLIAEELPHVTLSVIPAAFLKKYTDAEKCEELLQQTSSQPLKFGPRRTRSEKELTAWISDMSRGKGRDGATLYAQCDGRCSPRYFMDISRDGDGFIANLDVVCGPARDKSDNTYAISSGYRWACQPKY